MSEDEEQIAAEALGDLLTSAMMAAYNEVPPRAWLYCWEREALQWLLRFKERRPDGHMSSDWTAAFIDLNRDAIMNPAGKMDFNLRRARLLKEGQPEGKYEVGK